MFKHKNPEIILLSLSKFLNVIWQSYISLEKVSTHSSQWLFMPSLVPNFKIFYLFPHFEWKTYFFTAKTEAIILEILPSPSTTSTNLPLPKHILASCNGERCFSFCIWLTPYLCPESHLHLS